MSENYKAYLGSEMGLNYEESIDHIMGRVNYIYGEGYWDIHDVNEKLPYKIEKLKPTKIEENLYRIETGLGNSLACMSSIANMYEAKASSDLLLHADVKAFKQDAYVGAKLEILSSEMPAKWISGYNTYAFFLPIMSDNPDLIRYVSSFAKHWEAPYKRTDTYRFFLVNTILAVAGEWERLKPRAKQFIDEPKKVKRDKYCLADHEFYFALCEGDVAGMELALNKLLEPKLAKKAAYDHHTYFDFYLQVQVVMYAKIASIHGYDLDIDSPIAPKELIKYEPLEHYEDPYDFMKDFDYNDHQGWIDMWEEKMCIAKEQEAERKKLKNRILSLFKK